MDRMGRLITGQTETRWPLLTGPQHTRQHLLGNGSFPENSALLRRKQHFKVNPGLITRQAIEPRSPALQAEALTSEPRGKPVHSVTDFKRNPGGPSLYLS